MINKKILAYLVKDSMEDRCNKLLADGLINGYEVTMEDENFTVAPDGILEHDVVIDVKLVPKRVPSHINMKIKIDGK
jgi:hypothetical protein